jgi:enamine deaminase RidA (YjgF/YER057c/UK114 family)
VPTVVCNDHVRRRTDGAQPWAGLNPRAHLPEHSPWAGTEIRKQTELLIREKLEPPLEAAGSSLERSLKAQIYLAKYRGFPGLHRRLDRALRRNTLRGDCRPDQILRNARRAYRDQPLGLDQHRDAQAAAIYNYAEALCRAAGAAMANTLRAQYFVSDVPQFPSIAMVWAARFGAQPHPFIRIQTPNAMPAPGAALIADFWISTS